MIQRREHFRFALESRQPFAIGGNVGGKNLDRDLALQLRVARAIHLAHAAGAKRRDHLVRAETHTREEGHGGSANYSRAAASASDSLLTSRPRHDKSVAP